MKALLIATLALALPAIAEETKLGAGVTLKDATPISAIAANPQDYVGKTVRIDGVATAVCSEMGCWMAVGASDAKDAPTIRLQVNHDGKIVFPVSAKGKQVSAEGTFEAVGTADTEARDEAKASTKIDAKAFTEYQLKATGAVIR